MTRQEGFQAEQEATIIAGRRKHVAWQQVEVEESCCHGDAAQDACRNTSAMLKVDEEEGSRAWVPREGGGEEKTIKYKSQPSQAETQTLPPPAGPEECWSTAGQSSWELKTFQKSRSYANTALTLACLNRACSWALDLGFVFDIFSASS